MKREHDLTEALAKLDKRFDAARDRLAAKERVEYAAVWARYADLLPANLEKEAEA